MRIRLPIIVAAAALAALAAAAAPAAQLFGGAASDTNALTGTYRERESKDEEIGRKVLAVTARLERDDRERIAK